MFELRIAAAARARFPVKECERHPIDRLPTDVRDTWKRGRLIAAAPLWRWTTLRVGGPARWLWHAAEDADLDAGLAWAQEEGFPVAVLGGGSNLLVPDEGFDGLVVLTRDLRGERTEGRQVTAACGVPLSALARRMTRAGLSGLERACGIPGTVGGAVAMNAGAYGGDVASVLTSVCLWTDGDRRTISAGDLHLGYRTSALRTGRTRGVVVEATFRLHPDDPARCRDRARTMLAQRRTSLPRGASAGCIFKNPQQGSPAGALLDQAGCKGLCVGDAVVSDVHANVIVNHGTQNAGDVLALMQRMRDRVLTVHGVRLEPEVEILRPKATLPDGERDGDATKRV